MEVSCKEFRVLGRAFFRTKNGLIAKGEGILHDAPVSIYEFGRRRQDILTQIDTKDQLLFFRRLVSDNLDVNIVGTVSPCLDVFDRNGFVGACVAVSLDNRKHPRIQDWGRLGAVLAHGANELSRDTLQKPLHDWCSSLTIEGEDSRFNWRVPRGHTLYMHREQGMTARDVLRSMQVVAQRYGGNQYPTILVLEHALEGFESYSLGSPEVRDDVKKMEMLQEDRMLRSNQQPVTPDPDHGRSTLNFSSIRTTEDTPSNQDLLAMVEVLTEQDRTMSRQIGHLEQEVERLQVLIRGRGKKNPTMQGQSGPMVAPHNNNLDMRNKGSLRVIWLITFLIVVVLFVAGVVYFL